MKAKTIKTHKATGQRLEFRKGFGRISSLYLLDENYNRIKCTKESAGGAFNAKGEQAFEIRICDNENLI